MLDRDQRPNRRPVRCNLESTRPRLVRMARLVSRCTWRNDGLVWHLAAVPRYGHNQPRWTPKDVPQPHPDLGCIPAIPDTSAAHAALLVQWHRLDPKRPGHRLSRRELIGRTEATAVAVLPMCRGTKHQPRDAWQSEIFRLVCCASVWWMSDPEIFAVEWSVSHMVATIAQRC